MTGCALLVSCSLLLGAAQGAAADGPGVQRVAGHDRYATAVAASVDVNPSDSVGSLVIANGQSYVDSIGGGVLAASLDAPLLLTEPDQLNDQTAAEVRRVLAPGGMIYVLGGERAVGPGVVDELFDLSGRPESYRLVRLAGSDRYETAVSAARVGGASAGGPIFLVSGLDFPDGLAVAPLAKVDFGEVLLTAGHEMPDATRAYLQQHDPAGSRTIAVGGAAAAAAPGAESIVGVDRYDTAALVADRFDMLISARDVGVASGRDWPDALVGAAYMGRVDGPLLLSDGQRLGQRTGEALFRLTGGPAQDRQLDSGKVFGGESVVVPEVREQLAS